MCMKKLIILFSLICVGVLFFASCEHYENVTFAKENSKQYLIYEDSEYSKAAIFTASEYSTRPNEGDIKLGKYYSFPFTTYFYSDELNKPDYI